MVKMTEDEIAEALSGLTQWFLENGALTREWRFEGFSAAMRFVNRVAEMAEEADHHPEIEVRYTSVRLRLISHDVGRITARDIRMARRLDAQEN